MSISLHGKVVIVTGAARGIGLATATLLKKNGAIVAIGDIDAVTLAVSAEKIGADFHAPLDVTKAEAFRAFVDEVEAKLGPLDVLINNAGIMPIGHIHDEPEELARRMFEINVFGAITGTKRALKTMRERNSGHIVNLSSIVGVQPAAGAATYSATKHAVVGFTSTAQLEYAHTNIEFTMVLPAFVNTDLTAGTSGLKLMKQVEPEQVAEAIVGALEKPRAKVFVPKSVGYLVGSERFMPPPLVTFIRRLMGADTALLDDVDEVGRAAYKARISSS